MEVIHGGRYLPWVGSKLKQLLTLGNGATLEAWQSDQAEADGAELLEHGRGAIQINLKDHRRRCLRRGDTCGVDHAGNQGAFLMRRLRKVRAEFSLTALAYNLGRVLNIVAFPTLMAALWV